MKEPEKFDYPWYHNEFKQIASDFNTVYEVEIYDKRMNNMRGLKAENEEIISLLKPNHESDVIEIGCGTANFSIAISSKCKYIYAIDISDKMLEYAQQKASKKDIKNITFIKSGFLSYKHESKVDYVVTSLALHHLSSFWKQIAFQRMNKMLIMGGKLFLQDAIFQIPNLKIEESIEDMIKLMEVVENKTNFINGLKDEYFTYDWIIEKMIELAGFKIQKKYLKKKFLSNYLCEKVSEI